MSEFDQPKVHHSQNIEYKGLFSLTGKVALVTGGAGLLGSHFCRGLASAGANVAILDIDGEKAKQLAGILETQYGINSKGYTFDISSLLSIQVVISAVISDFKEINILLNNVAGKSSDLESYFASFEEYTLEKWKEIMSINIDGMFLVAQSVGRQMIAQNRGGSIIQTSSIYGLIAPDQRIYKDSNYLGHEINTPAVYSVSKAAVIGLTNYLATYWAKHNIRVNTLIPGGVESGQNSIFVNNYSNRVPMNRMAQPNELVGAVLYLASEASSYVTGQNMIVDGGLSTW